MQQHVAIGSLESFRAKIQRCGARVVEMALLAAMLAACGGLTSPSGQMSRQPGAGSALCRSVAILDRLVVHRIINFPQNHMRFSFPAEMIVHRASTVQAVARALCALPVIPKGPISCPAGFGVDYHFAFFAGERAFPAVDVDPSSCQSVRGIGSVRWVMRSPEFWPALGRALELSSSTYATFRGSGPYG